MSTEELERAVAQLPPDELAAFAAWFERYTRRTEIFHKIDEGLAAADRGDVGPLNVEDVKRRGRERLVEQQQATTG